MGPEVRFILTDKCNYHCWFCHREGMDIDNSNDEMNFDEIKLLLSEYKKWSNNDEITLTGGEPLIYKNIHPLIDYLYSIGYKITITTNGFVLPQLFNQIEKIKKFNVSFHTNERNIYEKMVGKQDSFLTVKNNLQELRRKNKNIEISLNVTIINSFNSSFENIERIIEFAREIKANIKLIEYFPSHEKHNYSLDNYVEFLKIKKFKLVDKQPRKLRFYDGSINITLSKIFCEDAINNYNSDKYCNQNNDLFLSYHGYFKLCRYSEEKIYVNKELRSFNISELRKKFELAQKKLGYECSEEYYNSRKETIIESTKNFIKDVFMSESSGHDYYHSIRVYNNAVNIYNNDIINADLFIIKMIALLHDVEDYKLFDLNNYGKVHSFLVSQRIPIKERTQIESGIKQISFHQRMFSEEEVSDEVKIVQDADVLDAIGAIGIARTFAYGGKIQRPIYDPDIEPKKFFEDKGDYKKNIGTSINHFYEKILKLPDMMNTPYGKECAKMRKIFVLDFLKEFMEEWQGVKA